MKDQLLQEKAEIEKHVKTFEKIIEEAKTGIYWQKKRLRIVNDQLASLPEEKKNGDKVDS